MTEPPYLHAVRASYDTVATDYAEILRDELAKKPLDRAMLAAFADLTRAVGPGLGPSPGPGFGPVADIGCGPGRVTAHLDSLGMDAFGIDLSPGMIEVARREHPALRFDVGSMTALDLPDGGLGGVVAWYSIIHTPPELLPTVFAEFHRVLMPGGLLLLAFQVGDETLRLEHAYGHPIALEAHRLPPDRVGDLLNRAGFVPQARLLREPDGAEKTPQAFLLVRKSES